MLTPNINDDVLPSEELVRDLSDLNRLTRDTGKLTNKIDLLSMDVTLVLMELKSAPLKREQTRSRVSVAISRIKACKVSLHNKLSHRRHFFPTKDVLTTKRFVQFILDELNSIVKQIDQFILDYLFSEIKPEHHFQLNAFAVEKVKQYALDMSSEGDNVARSLASLITCKHEFKQPYKPYLNKQNRNLIQLSIQGIVNHVFSFALSVIDFANKTSDIIGKLDKLLTKDEKDDNNSSNILRNYITVENIKGSTKRIQFLAYSIKNINIQ